MSIHRFKTFFSLKGSAVTFSVVVLFVVLDLVVFVFPYLVNGYAVPVGWDKPWYILNMRLIEEQGILSLFEEIHQVSFFSTFEYAVSYVSGASFMLTAGVVPIACAISFLFVYFRITQKLSSSLHLGIFSMVLTIIDWNLLRMVGVSVDRGLFTFLMIALSLFIVLPRLLEKQSKMDLALFSILQIFAGLSQMETYAINVLVLAIFIAISLKTYPLKKIQIVLLGTLVPLVFVLVIQFPYLPKLLETHIINPASSWAWRPIEGEIAQPVSYLLSMGSGLIAFFVLGLHKTLRSARKDKERSLPLLIFLWNIVVVAFSFAPIAGLRIPGWRLLLLVTVPPIATIGFSEFFLKKSLTVKRMVVILGVAAITCTILVVNQNVNYRPWVSREEVAKLDWIASNKQSDSVIFILYYDFGISSREWAELHSRWVRSIVGTRTNIYFGEVGFLMHSEPTPSSNFHVNYTSYEFWGKMKDVSPAYSENYLIVEWYEASIDSRYSREVARAGVYLSETR